MDRRLRQRRGGDPSVYPTTISPSLSQEHVQETEEFGFKLPSSDAPAPFLSSSLNTTGAELPAIPNKNFQYPALLKVKLSVCPHLPVSYSSTSRNTINPFERRRGRWLPLILALVLLLRSGDSQLEQTFSGGPSFRNRLGITDSSAVRKLSPGTANERRWATLGNARTVVTVKDFGARGEGSSNDTKAFAAAWKAACSSATPVTMLVPEGKAYRLKPVTFSGPCKSAITVAIKGTILASGRISDWDGTRRSLWMKFTKVDGLRVEGGGTIDGNGHVWWKVSCKLDSAQPCKGAPTALTFRSCRGLTVNNLRFKNAQQMHVTFAKCANVQISRLTISAPGNSPNTDGIHVSGSTDVKISDCVIRTGDDCISIVSRSHSITATNIVCGPGHGISIGSLGANGAEHTVSDVLVDTARLEGTTNGVRIKTWQGGKGYARNITFMNIVMDKVKNPIIIDQNYCDSSKPCNEQKSAVGVSGVTYKNVSGTSATAVAMTFDCSRIVPCRGIRLQDINLVTTRGAFAKSFCRNVNLSKRGTIVPSRCS
ncbi:unnamed protein product [Spirodela intermedia]|uniref:endo-polygalacturonase n=1 Tax=Spirodela intermedia TaxID=51605 RepID=A0A7I8JW09_SPIIN|nr:unnamed protein product [Spirodela intermedia]